MKKIVVAVSFMLFTFCVSHAVSNQVRLKSGVTVSNPTITYTSIGVTTTTTETTTLAAVSKGVRRTFVNVGGQTARIKYGSATNCATLGLPILANERITDDGYFGAAYFSTAVAGSSTTIIMEQLQLP